MKTQTLILVLCSLFLFLSSVQGGESWGISIGFGSHSRSAVSGYYRKVARPPAIQHWHYHHRRYHSCWRFRCRRPRVRPPFVRHGRAPLLTRSCRRHHSCPPRCSGTRPHQRPTRFSSSHRDGHHARKPFKEAVKSRDRRTKDSCSRNQPFSGNRSHHRK